MFEIERLVGETYYMKNPSRVGVLRLDDKRVCLIDSCTDKEAGRRMLQRLRERGWEVESIVCTHHHADHIGANLYLQQETGCRIYAPGAAAALTRHTFLNPSLLFSAAPPGEMRTKGYLAQESEVTYLTEENVPGGMEIIPLPGHSFDMVGYRTGDDVVFLGDSLCDKGVLDKFKICYIYDVREHIATLERLKGLEAKIFVPSHVAPTENILPIVEYNLESTYEIAETIRSICIGGKTYEQLLQAIFKLYRLRLDFGQYFLIGSTLKAYLKWLRDQGQVESVFDDCLMIWRAI